MQKLSARKFHDKPPKNFGGHSGSAATKNNEAAPVTRRSNSHRAGGV
jgi:hypothetical protein